MRRLVIILPIIICLFIISCGPQNDSSDKVYGVPVQKNLIPCSAGPYPCDHFDGLQVGDETYFLIKDVQKESKNVNEGYICNNLDCAIYCTNSSCYQQDSAGNSFVYGRIVSDPDNSDVNLKKYILVSQLPG